MSSQSLVYAAYLVAFVVMMSFGWLRNRNLLHPHFMFTAMLCVFYSDFVIRGYDDPMMEVIPEEQLHVYQWALIGVFFALSILTGFIRTREGEATLRTAWQHVKVTNRTLMLLQSVGWALLIGEIVKRLNTVDWSVAEMIRQMEGPRFERDWDQIQYGGNFIFAILSLLIPFTATTFAYVAANAKFGSTVLSVIGYLVAIIIMVTDGHRTPVAIGLAAPVAFILMSNKSRVIKLLVSGIAAVAGAAALSAMYLFRTTGYVSQAGSSQEFEFTYHQDDSYYRALWSYYYSDVTGDSWDVSYFIYSILSNPVPRFFWADKPSLDERYYGGFKLWYTTNLFLGEIVALAGTTWAPIISIGAGVFIYVIFYKAASLLRYPFGVVAYILVALYIYMTMRSLLNLTMFIYLPAFAVIITRAVGGGSNTLTSLAIRNQSIPRQRP